MTNDRRYADACYPRSTRIFGVRLRPFSLGHWLLLEATASPFVPGTGDAEITSEQLLEAIVICSRQFSRARRALENGLPFAARWWALRCVVACALRGDLLLSRAAMFLAYVSAGSQGPKKYVEQSDSTQESGVPSILRVKQILMTHGYSEAEVLDMPIGQALWEVYSTQDAEARGITIATERDYDRAEKAV